MHCAMTSITLEKTFPNQRILILSFFFMKTYIVGTLWNCLTEAILMSSTTCRENKKKYLGSVVQSIISLTSLLVVKMLTVLVSTISNSQVFLLKKCVAKCKSYSHFFSKNISVYAIFNGQSFKDNVN